MRSVQSAMAAAVCFTLAGADAVQAQFVMSYPISARQEYSEFGVAVAIVRDVDGDGIDDFLIGARGEHSTPEALDAAGAAHLYSGATGDLIRSVFGAGFNHNLGAALASIGDVNNDGRSDYIITILGLNAVRAYSGASGATLYTIYGSPNTEFGRNVADAGDVNNDGRRDFIIGAPEAFDGNGFQTGAAWVHSGLDGIVLYTCYGDSNMDRFGAAVAGAGDINNDGYDDFIVGAPRDDDNGLNCGSARVYSGATGAVLRTIIGVHAGDECGHAVSAAGDVNNDGFGDFMVGAIREDQNATDGGSVRVYSGASGGVLRALHGTTNFEFVGAAVGAVGDVNGDGFDDVILGTAWADGAVDDVGRVQIVSGADGAILQTEYGSLVLSGFGSKFGLGGDLNGDGLCDVILGQEYDSTFGAWTGSVRFLMSRAAFPAPCPGNANNDSVVNFDDINAVIANWLNTCP